MASTSRLTVYTKSSPPAYGPLALASHITQASGTENVISIEYEEKSEDPNEICRLDSGRASCNTLSSVIRSLAEAFASVGVLGHDKAESEKITTWIAFAEREFGKTADFASVTAVVDQLDHHLTLRSFLVGYRPTAADFALWGAAKGSTVFLGLLKRAQHANVARWYSHIESLPAVQSSVSAYVAAQKDKLRNRTSNATFELGLEGAEMGKVVTRLPPEPSGYLHIGHAKAAILNKYFARMYQGKFIVRYDDTNPSKEKAEFQQSIIEDLALLDIVGDKVSYTSDFFDDIYKFAIEAIKNDKAYADDTPQEQMQHERREGIPSSRRDASVEDNLARFAEMTTGSVEGLRWCVRAKLSYNNPNKALRDPVIYRCNIEPHHRTGTQWKVYPTYDFACPVVDSLEGVTHALRTNEYRDRNPQYWWMQKALGLRKVAIWDYGRINFAYTLLSKRKLKAMVEDRQMVEGWDDPRFPTIRGVRRRGMAVEALTQYMLAQGPSQQNNTLDWDGIWTANKKVLDPVVPRHTAVLKEGLVECHVVDEEGKPVSTSSAVLPKHKKYAGAGSKTTFYSSKMYIEQEDAVSFAANEEVTLMDWGNAVVDNQDVSSPIKSLNFKLHLAGDFKATSKKITWLAVTESAPLLSVILKDYDYLITKRRIEDSDEWTDYINPVTEFRQEAFADPNLRDLKKGDTIQFERKGFYIVDKVASGDDLMELIYVPDGKASSIALKAAPAAPKKAEKVVVEANGLAPPISNGLPDLAPTEAQDRIIDSRGLPIPVKTKMYRVDSPTGDYRPLANTKMHSVPSFTS